MDTKLTHPVTLSDFPTGPTQLAATDLKSIPAAIPRLSPHLLRALAAAGVLFYASSDASAQVSTTHNINVPFIGCITTTLGPLYSLSWTNTTINEATVDVSNGGVVAVCANGAFVSSVIGLFVGGSFTTTITTDTNTSGAGTLHYLNLIPTLSSTTPTSVPLGGLGVLAGLSAALAFSAQRVRRRTGR